MQNWTTLARGRKTTISDLSGLSQLKLYSTTASVTAAARWCLLNICLHRYRTLPRARPRCHRQVRAVPPCHESAALPWHEWRLADYKAVDLSKLLYASPALWSYTSAADKRRLKATVRRAIRLGLYTADDLTPSWLAADMDDNIFAHILNDPGHFLYKLLPNNTEHTYNRRHMRHSLSLKSTFFTFLTELQWATAQKKPNLLHMQSLRNQQN